MKEKRNGGKEVKREKGMKEGKERMTNLKEVKEMIDRMKGGGEDQRIGRRKRVDERREIGKGEDEGK